MLPYHFIDVAEVLFDDGAQWRRDEGVPLFFTLVQVVGLHAVDRRSLHVVTVEAIGEVPVQPGGDATRNGYSHAEHVDRDEDFVPQEISKGDEKIVLEHGR